MHTWCREGRGGCYVAKDREREYNGGKRENKLVGSVSKERGLDQVPCTTVCIMLRTRNSVCRRGDQFTHEV